MRVTTSMDDETFNVFESLTGKVGRSKSSTIRDAILFYDRYRDKIKEEEKIDLYWDMLSSGEHIILDLDYWTVFMKIVEGLDSRDEFWEAHRAIARSHAEQWEGKAKNMRDVLRHLEDCNFFKMSEVSDNEFTLIIGPISAKKFIKSFIEEIADRLGFEVQIKEDLTKLRVEI